MADITKPVDRGILIQGRTQSFTQEDAGEGDVLMIEDSLGRSARVLTIESAGGMSVRVNVYHMVAPPRLGNDLMYTEGMPNLALSERVKNDSQALIQISAEETLVIDEGLTIRDLEIVTCSGLFEILAT